MKLIDTATRQRFAADTTTLCQCWTLIRKDGAVLRATDHDQALTYKGEVFEPGLALESSAIEHNTGLAPEPLDIQGALDIEGLQDADIRDGLWDGAQIRIDRVDWRTPDHGLFLWSGYLSDIQIAGASFRVGLVSQKAALERTIGRVCGRRCDAELGDARCTIDLASVPQTHCDKSYATCRDVFANSLNFRGFPFMPGNDAVISGPGVQADGGSRGEPR